MARNFENLNQAMEAAFNLEGNESDWLRGVANAAIPWFENCQNLVAAIFDFHGPEDIQITTQISRSSANIARLIEEICLRFMREEKIYLLSQRCHQSLLSDFAIQFGDLWGMLRRRGIKDCLFLWSINPQGPIFALCFPIISEIDPNELKLSSKKFHLWEKLLAFFDAGLRLHRALTKNPVLLQKSNSSKDLSWTEVSATKSRTPKDHLRALMLHLEKMKEGHLVKDPKEAEVFVQWLFTGESTQVDAFQTQTMQYIFAKCNEQGLRDPRALSEIEYNVAMLAIRGFPNKMMAADLGISLSTVATHLTNIQLKHGQNTRLCFLESTRNLLIPTALHAFWLKIAGDRYTVLAKTRRKMKHLSQLSPGSLDVLHLILQGKTNLEIANLRGTSPRTVANQIAALFNKYNVSSRSELVARLTSNRSTLRRYPTL